MSTTLEQSAFAPPAGADNRMGHLDWLEAESIHILRELVAECSKPALLFSGGKDSVVVLHLALKAFGLGANRKTTLPFPLVHIDTGHNYEEVIEFRDRRAQELGAELVVGHVEDSIKRGTVVLRRETDSRNAAQAVTLLETIEQHGYGADRRRAPRRREGACEGTHLLVPRRIRPVGSEGAAPGTVEPVQRPPTRASTCACSRSRTGPKLDVWQYIARENLELPSIYYAHQREIVRRNGLLVPVTPLTPMRDGETSARAGALPHGRRHLLHVPGRERRGRRREDHRRDGGDRDHRARRDPDGRPGLEAAMEQRKKQGYF